MIAIYQIRQKKGLIYFQYTYILKQTICQIETGLQEKMVEHQILIQYMLNILLKVLDLSLFLMAGVI